MKRFVSKNPATGETLWEGPEAEKKEIEEAISKAKASLPSWKALSIEKRISFLHQFSDLLKKNAQDLAKTISMETGKPFWESETEVSSMIKKIEISIEAEAVRCSFHEFQSSTVSYTLRHKPHGIIAVFGPFNFPGHLPNGHIVPALLAGNTVIFKSSELTPLISEKIAHLWHQILPKGIFNLIQGGPETGRLLLEHPEINGLFFTGSQRTGQFILDTLGAKSEKILALEMGGNNPLVVDDAMDLEAACYLIIQSAFLTAGQRCSCTRRLIVVENKKNQELIPMLTHMMKTIRIGPYTDTPEPFMGPVISLESCHRLLQAQETLENSGAKSIVKMMQLKENTPFLTPGVIDISLVKEPADVEYFGPFLQVIKVGNFEEAIEKANQTQFGLTASLISADEQKFHHFFHSVNAGIINWNQPTTGANSRLPFGGVKKSGNHRPSAYYAADYSAYPVATSFSQKLTLPTELLPGITIDART